MKARRTKPTVPTVFSSTRSDFRVDWLDWDLLAVRPPDEFVVLTTWR